MASEDQDLASFAKDLQSETSDRALGDLDGGEFSENAFVELVSEHLAEIGMLENPVTCFFQRRMGAAFVKLNGYAIPDDGERIDLFVAIYGATGEPSSISATELNRAASQASRVLVAAKRELHLEMERASSQFDMIERISDLLQAGAKQARVFLFSNGLCSLRSIEDMLIGDVSVSFEIYDLQRLMRTMSAGQTREIIDFDFAQMGLPTIPCVAMPPGLEPYETYLAIFSGTTLYQMYEEFGSRILEYNVRAFLQAAGKVNRGIRDTIRDQPGHFMAYNNGISITADEVRTKAESSGLVITGFKGLQIVNGGQTTASIHRARKRDRLDLSQIHVPAKVTRLRPEIVEEMVPRISRFANTQNVVQEADFSSNEPFHIAIERLSREVWAPGERTRWFYERSRGQYQTAMSREGSTPARLRAFRERTPPLQRFSKTDLARFINTWNRLPHVVSGGIQRNFVAYMRRLREARGARWEPDATFFRETISLAILFTAAQRVVRREKFPAYQINIAIYLMSYLAHRTGGRMALPMLWEKQAVSPSLEGLLASWSHEINQAILDSAQGRNVTEWCKKEACWHAVRELDLPIGSQAPDEWAAASEAEEPVSFEGSAVADDHASAASCMKVSSERWFGIHLWGIRSGHLARWQSGIALTLSSYAAGGWEKAPSIKQAKHGVRILQIADEHGFDGAT
ncbi:hypothetical protein sos41_13920 [Alphaproteobacteria bacterium SO-S41]|nr:hypothetical protein sos41_13920 [Alphaproteobacteria bacterium SO-S41]